MGRRRVKIGRKCNERWSRIRRRLAKVGVVEEAVVTVVK